MGRKRGEEKRETKATHLRRRLQRFHRLQPSLITPRSPILSLDRNLLVRVPISVPLDSIPQSNQRVLLAVATASKVEVGGRGRGRGGRERGKRGSWKWMARKGMAKNRTRFAR